MQNTRSPPRWEGLAPWRRGARAEKCPVLSAGAGRMDDIPARPGFPPESDWPFGEGPRQHPSR
eukprot:5043451-Prymnesium_polylepis.1